MAVVVGIEIKKKKKKRGIKRYPGWKSQQPQEGGELQLNFRFLAWVMD